MHVKRKKSDPMSLKPVQNVERLNAIIDAVSKLSVEQLQDHNAWNDLSELSSHTMFEGIEPHPDGIFESDPTHFEAVATVYVTLNYGGKRDGTSMSDSYPAKVVGEITANGKVTIETISVDTSSFYQ